MRRVLLRKEINYCIFKKSSFTVIFTIQQDSSSVLICILGKLYASGLVFKGHINPCGDKAVLLL